MKKFVCLLMCLICMVCLLSCKEQSKISLDDFEHAESSNIYFREHPIKLTQKNLDMARSGDLYIEVVLKVSFDETEEYREWMERKESVTSEEVDAFLAEYRAAVTAFYRAEADRLLEESGCTDWIFSGSVGSDLRISRDSFDREDILPLLERIAANERVNFVNVDSPYLAEPA